MQQEKSSDGNQDRILKVIRTKLDKNLDKLTKAKPDISSLAKELFILKQETNTLLEAQSAQYRATQEKITAAKKIFKEGVDDTAGKKLHYQEVNLTIFVQNEWDRPWQPLKNCRHEDSTGIESDKSDDDFATEDCQFTRTERQEEISFFGTKKGPHDALTVTKSFNTAFVQLMNFRC